MWTPKSLALRFLMLASAVMFLPACASLDRSTYHSTPYSPKTVRIVATQTSGGVLWEKPVPVYHKLLIDLSRSGEFDLFKVDPSKPADSFQWSLMDDHGKRVDSGREKLPGVPVITQVVLRPSPEWPDNFVPPGTEQPATVPVEMLPDQPQPAPEAAPAPTEEAAPTAPTEEAAPAAPADEQPEK